MEKSHKKPKFIIEDKILWKVMFFFKVNTTTYFLYHKLMLNKCYICKVFVFRNQFTLMPYRISNKKYMNFYLKLFLIIKK